MLVLTFYKGSVSSFSPTLGRLKRDSPIISWLCIYIGMCFSSGLGATTSIVHMLKAGDHIISIDDVYGGTNRYFSKVATKFGIKLSFCDMTADPEKLREAMTPETKV